MHAVAATTRCCASPTLVPVTGDTVGQAEGGAKLMSVEDGSPRTAAAPDLAFYAFPTLEQLSNATEAALRAEGFGYR